MHCLYAKNTAALTPIKMMPTSTWRSTKLLVIQNQIVSLRRHMVFSENKKTICGFSFLKSHVFQFVHFLNIFTNLSFYYKNV